MKEKNSETLVDGTEKKGISKKGSSNYEHRRFVQNFILIWLHDTTPSSSPVFQSETEQLRTIVNDVYFFTDLDECVAFIGDIRLEKVYVITSNSMGQKLMPLIQWMVQLRTVYILCDKYPQDQKWIVDWSKIEGIYDQIESIGKALQVAVRRCDRDCMPISFIPPSRIDDSTLNLDHLESSFMYTQLFKYAMLNIEHHQSKVQQMVNHCRRLYATDRQCLQIIDEFSRTYCPNRAIWWYTRENFIYQALNRALRLLEIDTIVNMGFFLHDLHQQLAQLHTEQIRDCDGKSFVVYRGQGLITADFERLKNNQGGLMSFNGFLSTSTNRNVSLMYAESVAKASGMVGILFEMLIDPNNSPTPFASIHKESYFGEEDEVLFTMHTVFRIIDVQCLDDTNCLFQVHMSITIDDDVQLRAITERYVEELQDSSGWHRVGRIILLTGNVEKAEELYNALLSQSTSEKDEAECNHQLGCIRSRKEYHHEAIHFFKKSLQFWEKTSSENYANLSTCYESIGSVYDGMNEFANALIFYEKALEIRRMYLSENHSSMAAFYNDVGSVYYGMGDYSKALAFYERALKIKETTFPSNHPCLVVSYSNIGCLYQSIQKYPEALSFCEKALNIRQLVLPPNHPDLAISHNNLGCIYQEMEDNQKAIDSFQKALDIWQQTLPESHSSSATVYNNIGSIYVKLEEYSKALFFYEKALDIDRVRLPECHHDIAVKYNNIGKVYENMKNYSQALSFYIKALHIWQTVHPENYDVLAVSYNNIAGMYSSLKAYSEAMPLYEKALHMRLIYLPENYTDLAVSYNNIALLYHEMGEHTKALFYYVKAMDMWQRTPFETHSLSAVIYHNTALAYTNMAEYASALPLYEKAVDIYQKTLPANSVSLANVNRDIGMAYSNMDQHRNALPFYEKSLDIHKHNHPLNYPALADIYTRMALGYGAIGEDSKTMPFVMKSFQMLFKHYFFQTIRVCTMFMRITHL